MNELDRLEAALRSAHAAGDEAAAQRFAQAIRELQAAPGGATAAGMPSPNYERAVANDGWRDVPPPAKAPPATSPVQGGTFGGSGEFNPSGGAGGEFSSPRQEGRDFAANRSPVGAAIQGVGSSLLGVGVPIAAVDEYLRSRASGKPKTWNQSLEFARGLREGSAETYPAEYAAGNVLGLIGSAEGAGAALSKAPAIVKSVFTLQKGQVAKNLARLAATGAVTAGTTAGMQEGTDAIPGAAAAGAVIAPVVAGATGAAVSAANWAGSKINPSNAAIRILSKRLGESADAIAARYNDFMQTMGRKPSLIEIMQRPAAEEMGQISASKTGVEAGRVFREAGQRAVEAQPQELQNLVQQGGPTGTVLSLARARDKAFKHTLSQIGDQSLTLDNKIRDVVEDPEVQAALPPILRRRINNAIETGTDLGSVELTVNEFDMMRQAVNKKIGAGAGQLYKDYRDKLRGYVVDQVPEYGAALEKYSRYSQAMQGAKVGQRVLTSDAEQFQDAVTKAADNSGGMKGVEIRARSKIANKVGESPAAAISTTAAMAENPGLQSRIATALGDPEAARLQSVGAASTRATRNFAAATPGATDAQRQMQSQAQQIQEVIGGGVALLGKTSGAMKANIMNNITQRLRMSKGVATRLAEMAVDPNNADKFISRIRQAGVRQDEILQWYRNAALAAGITTGGMVGGPQ